MKRAESRTLWRIDTDKNVPQWMTPQYSTTVGIVRNRADRALVVSAMSGAVFQDNSLSAADHHHRRKTNPIIYFNYVKTNSIIYFNYVKTNLLYILIM